MPNEISRRWISETKNCNRHADQKKIPARLRFRNATIEPARNTGPRSAPPTYEIQRSNQPGRSSLNGSHDIPNLRYEFLEEVRRLPQKNLAIEALRKLLNDQLKAQSKKNLVQSRFFSDMLQTNIQKYQNRSLDTAEIIAELVTLAKNLREATEPGRQAQDER
jgi:hypothetical protein